ncbi:ABC transporter substrate-binding protein [Microbacterium aurantiacum]|uniref:Extracellular solute-binding protein n=1 Tax=Microbacterium aurantiacum TaxID=162393 RepID=A0AAJ2HI66_9MICO|nr:extracellular solute-binding protein [Microbacterium aurantiacum]MDS0244296.1 extracellular solute-binding protein [Microbacterium aurantiacum]
MTHAQHPLLRWGTTTAVLLTTALAVSGCSDPGGNGEAQGPVTLTLGYGSAATGEAQPFEEIVERFNAEQDEIVVETVATPIADYGNLLRTQLQAGNAPDVITGAAGRGDVTSFLPYADAGYLLPLGEYAFVTDRVPAGADALFFDESGEIYGMPLAATVLGMVNNLTAREAASLELPATWDALLDQCADADSAGPALMTVATTNPANAGLFMIQLAANTVYAADPEWNAKRVAGETTFASTPAWTEALEHVVTLQDAGCFTAGIEQAGTEDSAGALLAGEALQRPGPSPALAAISGGNPDMSFAMSALPAATTAETRAVVDYAGTLVGINSETSNPDAAAVFLEYLTQPEINEIYAAGGAEIPLSNFENGSFPEQYAPMADALGDPERALSAPQYDWPSGEIYDALAGGFQGLLTGQATPEMILDAMDAAWDRAAG